MPRTDPRIALLLDALDEAFGGRAWHGTALCGSVRGLPADRALWRPSPRRHSIWEIVLHTAYWKYAVWRRLTSARRGAFPRPGSNWPRIASAPTDAAWRADVRLLVEQHAALRETAAGLEPGLLPHTPPGSRWTRSQLILGVAAHDLYHTGQVQLIKKVMRDG